MAGLPADRHGVKRNNYIFKEEKKSILPSLSVIQESTGSEIGPRILAWTDHLMNSFVVRLEILCEPQL